MVIILYLTFLKFSLVYSDDDIKKCDAVYTYKVHLENYIQDTVPFDESGDVSGSFIPRSSCFICTKPICDFTDPNCTLISASKVIPIYNNFVEFGFFIFDYPSKFIANIKVTETCGYQVYLLSKQIGSVFDWEFRRCYDQNFTDCKKLYGGTFKDTDEDTCFLMSYKFFPNEMYEGFSNSCTSLSTKQLKLRKDFNDNYCKFTDDTVLTIQYMFEHEQTTEDGHVVILPCSSGGYSVDPLTGRFVSGDLCKSLLKNGEVGIQDAMEKIYKLNDDNIFPKMAKEELIQRIPMFLDHEGNPKSVKEMKSQRDVCHPVKRDGCQIILLPLSEQRKNDPKCKIELNNKFEDEKEDISVQVFNLPPLDISNYDVNINQEHELANTYLQQGLNDSNNNKKQVKKKGSSDYVMSVSNGCLETHGFRDLPLIIWSLFNCLFLLHIFTFFMKILK